MNGSPQNWGHLFIGEKALKWKHAKSKLLNINEGDVTSRKIPNYDVIRSGNIVEIL